MSKKGFLLLALLLVGSLLLAQERYMPEEEFSKPRFEKREEFIVMGLETTELTEEEAYLEHWMKFFEIQENIPEPVGNCIYGITYHGEKFDPATGTGSVYFVGMEIKEAVELPEALHYHKVPSGYYAVFEHRGDVENLGKTYEYIFGKWLYENGSKPASQEMFERYDERFIPGSEKSVVEIWVPLIASNDYQPQIEKEPKPEMKPDLAPEPKPEIMPEKQ